MLIALTKNYTKEYILQREVDSKNPTIFILGAVSNEAVARIQDSYTSYTKATGNSEEPFIHLNLKKKDIEFVRIGLRGWINFKDSDGKDIQPEFVVEFGENILSKKSISLFPLDIISELADEIHKLNTVTKEDETDFLSPSQ